MNSAPAALTECSASTTYIKQSNNFRRGLPRNEELPRPSSQRAWKLKIQPNATTASHLEKMKEAKLVTPPILLQI